MKHTPIQVSSYLEHIAFIWVGENCFVAKGPQCEMKGHASGDNVDKTGKKRVMPEI